MATSQIITQIIARIIFRIKQKELRNSGIKFLVFTGTVGKTTFRDAVAFALKRMGYKVKSNNLGYTNEVGILLTILGISKFSAKNPLDWFKLLRAKNNREGFACVELGADFYHDIPWFLEHFIPFGVFISGMAEKDWADGIEKTLSNRKKLLETVPKTGFVVYNIDDAPTKQLIEETPIQAQKITLSIKNKDASAHVQLWSKNIFSLPVKDFFHEEEFIEVVIGGQPYKIILNRPVFEPQLYALLAALGFSMALSHNQIPEKLFDKYQFVPNRLQFSKAKNDAIILEDSYKATPICTFWFLKTAANIQARKKILIITEMRPLVINSKYFYEKLANIVRFADAVYFLGPTECWCKIVNVNNKVEHITMADYPLIAERIIKQTDGESLILLKGSFRYQLGKLKQLLI